MKTSINTSCHPHSHNAILSTCYLINQMSSSILHTGISLIHISILINPFSSLLHMFLDMFILCRIFNLVFINYHPCQLSVIIGYSRTQKEYKNYDPVTKKYYTSADVTFFKSTPYFSNESPNITIEHVPLSQPVGSVESLYIRVTAKPLQIYTKDKYQAPILLKLIPYL